MRRGRGNSSMQSSFMNSGGHNVLEPSFYSNEQPSQEDVFVLARDDTQSTTDQHLDSVHNQDFTQNSVELPFIVPGGRIDNLKFASQVAATKAEKAE